MKPFREDRARWARRSVVLAVVLGALCQAQEPAAQPAAAPPAEAQPAAATPPAAQAPATGVVTANILVVRARPAAHYERVGQFARGDQVTVVGGNADWLEVNVPSDTRAWIAAQYLSPEGVVTANQVRLHSGPGLVFTTFATARQGEKLEVLGPPVDGWQQVRAPKAATAWVSRAYVRLVEPEAPAAAPAAPETKAATPPDTKTEPKPEAAAPAEPAAPAATPAPAEVKPDAAAPAAPAEAKPAAEAPVAAPAEPAAAPVAPAEVKPEAAAPAEPAAPAATPAPAEVKPEAAVPAEVKPEAAAPVAVPAVAETKSETPPAEAKPAAEAPVAAPAEPAAAPAAAEALPAAPAEVRTTPAPDAPIVMKEGILLSLKSQASELASHVLCLRVGQTAYPACYLKSARVDLTEWENRNVRVYGRELRIPGWGLAILHVQSIQVNLD